MTRRPVLSTLLASLALVLAACGTGTATDAPATDAPSSVPAQSAVATGSASVTPGEAPASEAAAACEVVDGAIGTAAEISGFSFPAGISVPAGGAITWANADGVPHTVTFEDGGCDSGTIAGGGSVTVTYLVPGTYPFMCRIHPAMQGSLQVEG